MRIGRVVLLVVLLAALAWPVQAVPLCAGAAPPASCCCPPDAAGGDGCGPRGCCCVREGAPAEPRTPEPPAPAAAGHHEVLPLPVPAAIALPAAASETGLAASQLAPDAGDSPALFLVLCSFRC